MFEFVDDVQILRASLLTLKKSIMIALSNARNIIFIDVYPKIIL
jgi:hypothetical protein